MGASNKSKWIFKIGLTNLSAATKACALIHGKRTGSDIASHIGLGVEVAAIAFDVALNLAVNLNLTGMDITLDVSHLANRHLTGVRFDFALDMTIDMHIVLETNGTDNLDTGRKNVCSVSAHILSECKKLNRGEITPS